MTSPKLKPSCFPPALPGFTQIRRYWDNHWRQIVAKIMPGEYYVTQQDEIVSTVLGSCISACIVDLDSGVGGMNHFMLPAASRPNDSWQNTQINASLRYGNVAMEHLINAVIKFGGRRERLIIKVFGGGRIINEMTDIGRRNIDFVRSYLRLEGMQVVVEDVGERFPRKVLFHPLSGKVKVKKLNAIGETNVVEQEKAYLDSLAKTPVAGEIDLF